MVMIVQLSDKTHRVVGTAFGVRIIAEEKTANDALKRWVELARKYTGKTKRQIIENANNTERDG